MLFANLPYLIFLSAACGQTLSMILFLDSPFDDLYHEIAMRELFPFDIRAVLTAPSKGLALKKTFAGALFLGIGYLVYTFITYLALLYDGVGFGYIWRSYGLFPIRTFSFDAKVAQGIHLLAMAGAFFCVSLGIMAVAIINFEELRGNLFFSARQAIRFALTRSRTLLAGLAVPLTFVVFVFILAALTGLLARVPLFGNLVISVFYVVPIFLTILITLFVIFVIIIAAVLLPVIVASQRQAALFDAIVQLFAVIMKQPVRFFCYLGVSALLAKLSSFVFAYFCYRAVQLSKLMLAFGGGERIDRLFASALGSLPLDSPLVTFMTQIIPGVRFGFALSRWGYGGSETVSGTILALAFFTIFLLVVGYMLSVIATGLARGYVVIRKIREDHNMIDEEPLYRTETPGDHPAM